MLPGRQTKVLVAVWPPEMEADVTAVLADVSADHSWR